MDKPVEYVVVHARRIDVDGPYDDILLVLKDRPAWQKGRLNLVGGKVEPGEDPITAAVRELKEEAGLEPWEDIPPILAGSVKGDNCQHKGGSFIIHCVRIDVDAYDSRSIQPREGETEKVDWYTFKEAWNDDRLMPNLKIVVPLLHLGVKDWTIVDQFSPSGTHAVTIQLPLAMPFPDGRYKKCEN